MIKKFKSFLESKKDKFPNIKKIDIDGYTVLMGRDAKSNDYLSTIMAKPEDLWFHAKGVPGSHVIIRSSDKLVTNEVKKQVAKIAAKNSKAQPGMVKVVCCKAKFVKKESDMKQGQVSIDSNNLEEIDVEI